MEIKTTDHLTWERVCGYDFTQSDANVICRMFGNPQGAENYTTFPLGKYKLKSSKNTIQDFLIKLGIKCIY